MKSLIEFNSSGSIEDNVRWNHVVLWKICFKSTQIYFAKLFMVYAHFFPSWFKFHTFTSPKAVMTKNDKLIKIPTAAENNLTRQLCQPQWTQSK